jgi:hypothetical protein
LTQVSDEELGMAWRQREATAVEHRTDHDGRLFLSVDAHPELGYRIVVPWYGKHLVSRDGRTVMSYLPNVPVRRWYRLLFAQVFPLSATLNGIPIFHASAVAFGDSALALVARSGTGKSSVAIHLLSRGASFVTDDVLALQPADSGVIAHPGGGMMSVHTSELDRLDTSLGNLAGKVLGGSGKVQVALPPVDEPVPLGGVLFLERSEAGSLEIVTRQPVDPIQLIASSFVTSVGTLAFPEAHLDLCARIAQSVPVHTVCIPPSANARDTADAIAEHVAR